VGCCEVECISTADSQEPQDPRDIKERNWTTKENSLKKQVVKVV